MVHMSYESVNVDSSGVSIIERPPFRIERYLRANGSPEIAMDAAVIRELVRTARDAFTRPEMPEEEVKEHAVRADLTLVASINGTIVGFSALKLDYDIKTKETSPGTAYLVATVVVHSERKKGLYSILTRVRLDAAIANGSTIIKTRTQNPTINELIERNLERMKRERVIVSFETSYERIREVYHLGGPLTADGVPQSSNEQINCRFRELDYSTGDAHLLTFTIRR